MLLCQQLRPRASCPGERRCSCQRQCPLLTPRQHSVSQAQRKASTRTTRRLSAHAGASTAAGSRADSEVWVRPHPDDFSAVVDANPTGLQLTFLGTAAEHRGRSEGRFIPARSRKFSLAVRTTRSTLLFECCEDTQRALLHAPQVRPSRITRIFVSCLDGDQICGLPGMLCTVSSAREKGHEMADVPLHLYGPVGLASYVDTLLRVSDTYLLMPVVIHEFGIQPPDLTGWTAQEAENWHPEYVQINRRAQLHVCMLPPDQLNPAGCYDGSQTLMLKRRRQDGGRLRGSDERSGALPLPLPPPGDPSAAGQVAVPDMMWTISSRDEGYMVVASPLPHDGIPCLAYTFVEADRSGMLDPEKAVALGVQPGRHFAQLKAGHAVETAEGRIVEAAEVLGPQRKGRRLLVLGESDQPQAPPLAADCTAVIAPASYKGEGAVAAAKSVAAELGAERLILTRHCDGGHPGRVQADVDEARAALQDGHVFTAVDLGILNLPRPEPAAPPQP